MKEMDNQPSCSTCDFMRRFNGAMRCLWDAPAPVLVGAVPPPLGVGSPQLLISGMVAEVGKDQFCRHHPDLRMDGELRQSPGYPPPAEHHVPAGDVRTDGGIILPAEATRQ